jgi:hypothetical protein
MTVSVAVGIIYLQNKEPIWQAAWILSAVCVTCCVSVVFCTGARAQKCRLQFTLHFFSRISRLWWSASPFAHFGPAVTLIFMANDRHRAHYAVCSWNNFIIWWNSIPSANHRFTPGGAQFCIIIFTRAQRERARAFACTMYWWNFIFSILPAAWIHNSTSTAAASAPLSQEPNTAIMMPLRQCPPVHIKHWIQIKL